MVAPHPSIVWQMNKTVHTINFVKEAAVALYTRADLDERERQLLQEEIEQLVWGEKSLTHALTVDDWRKIPLEWQTGKTAATIDFVNEAEHVITTDVVAGTETRLLRQTIDRMKRGEESLEEADTVAAWLERLREHHH